MPCCHLSVLILAGWCSVCLCYRDLVLRDVITGKKTAALAVSEPYAGSDVAGLKTTAERDGDVFVVNGECTRDT